MKRAGSSSFGTTRFPILCLAVVIHSCPFVCIRGQKLCTPAPPPVGLRDWPRINCLPNFRSDEDERESNHSCVIRVDSRPDFGFRVTGLTDAGPGGRHYGYTGVSLSAP